MRRSGGMDDRPHRALARQVREDTGHTGLIGEPPHDGLGEQFEGRRALPGDHVGIIERMHHRRAGIRHDPGQRRFTRLST